MQIARPTILALLIWVASVLWLGVNAVAQPAGPAAVGTDEVKIQVDQFGFLHRYLVLNITATKQGFYSGAELNKTERLG